MRSCLVTPRVRASVSRSASHGPNRRTSSPAKAPWSRRSTGADYCSGPASCSASQYSPAWRSRRSASCRNRPRRRAARASERCRDKRCRRQHARSLRCVAGLRSLCDPASQMRSLIATRSVRRGRATRMLSDDLRTNLIDVARLAILSAVHATPAAPPRPDDYPATLRASCATFVSLHSGDDLRGCCGTLEPHRALVLDVWHSAYAAACEDRRFAPVQPRELDKLELEISVLSPLTRIVVSDERALLNELRPGIDGLYLRHGGRRATFLPKVWANLKDRREFLHQLKRKAGLGERYWPNDIEWVRYDTECFGARVATETTCH